ncbi:MAG TPA: HAD family phosphatase [Candidatus Saccharimonadales bacterium]|nr:HAD family phosphatase [Candidatus Saccharimonadales bacterium]
MHQPKALLFDFFDVIRTDSYKAWLQANNIPHEGPYFEASRQQDMGAITTERFIEILSELTGRPVTTEEIDSTATVDDEVVRIIADLQKKYKLALISNAPAKFLRGLLAAHNLEQYFDIIVISSEVGMVKPDPEIFHLALQKLSIAPADAIFVDDNIRHVESAAKIGIHAIQFISASQLQAALAEFGVTLSS